VAGSHETGLANGTCARLTNPGYSRPSAKTLATTGCPSEHWPTGIAFSGGQSARPGLTLAPPRKTPQRRYRLDPFKDAIDAMLVCHPPAAWDQVEGFSAMSMGPPGRQ
jgi:hypothetical protein